MGNADFNFLGGARRTAFFYLLGTALLILYAHRNGYNFQTNGRIFSPHALEHRYIDCKQSI
jgi:hypothetical protein